MEPAPIHLARLIVSVVQVTNLMMALAKVSSLNHKLIAYVMRKLHMTIGLLLLYLCMFGQFHIINGKFTLTDSTCNRRIFTIS